MQVVVADQVAVTRQDQGKDRDVRPGGVHRQMLLHDNADDGLSFKFFRSQYQPGDKAFTSPRHRHAFQQLRWTESGAINYAPDRYIREGEMAFFPRGAFYGPQLKDTGTGTLLQFGFDEEHQYGGAWAEVREKALERLKESGAFEAGVYVDTDPETGERRERDSGQALYEEQYELLTGRTFTVPEPGYDEPILIHPQAFGYYRADDGVEVKNLGHFFAHPGPNTDVRFQMVRLSGAGSYELRSERAQIAWTTGAGLVVDGTTYPAWASVYSKRGEATTLACAEDIETYVVEFPRRD